MSGAVKDRFCSYCQSFKSDEGFKVILHANTGSKRLQCRTCTETRKRPRQELQKLADSESAARKKVISDATKRGIEQRKKNENPTNL